MFRLIEKPHKQTSSFYRRAAEQVIGCEAKTATLFGIATCVCFCPRVAPPLKTSGFVTCIIPKNFYSILERMFQKI